MTGAKSLDPADVKAVSDKLCENTSVIDEYFLLCTNAADGEEGEIMAVILYDEQQK